MKYMDEIWHIPVINLPRPSIEDILYINGNQTFKFNK